MKTARTKVLEAIETTRMKDNDKKIIKEIGQDIWKLFQIQLRSPIDLSYIAVFFFPCRKIKKKNLTRYFFNSFISRHFYTESTILINN